MTAKVEAAVPDAPSGRITEPAPRWRARCLGIPLVWPALGLWALVTLASMLRWGLPTQRDHLLLIIALGLFAASAGTPWAWARIARDWVPVLLLLDLYDWLRAHADGWSGVHFVDQIHAERFLFGGRLPTLVLQRDLFTPGHPHWWDYAAFVVYLSHFFVSLVVAGFLWKLAYPRFKRFVFLFVLLTFAAFATYAIYPAAPPWLAARSGLIGPTAKVIDAMWVSVGLKSAASVLSSNSHLANPVAAVPSLHSAYPFLLLLFFWPRAGWWRGLLALYPLAMGFALVYSGEHYVVDVLLGWAYATIVFVVGNLIADRWAAYRAREDARRELAALGGLGAAAARDAGGGPLG